MRTWPLTPGWNMATMLSLSLAPSSSPASPNMMLLTIRRNLFLGLRKLVSGLCTLSSAIYGAHLFSVTGREPLSPAAGPLSTLAPRVVLFAR